MSRGFKWKVELNISGVLRMKTIFFNFRYVFADHFRSEPWYFYPHRSLYIYIPKKEYLN